jgi:hypothetical protein
MAAPAFKIRTYNFDIKIYSKYYVFVSLAPCLGGIIFIAGFDSNDTTQKSPIRFVPGLLV